MSALASPADVYRAAILDHAPRVLGRIDREAASPTAGCCDRTYWAWKFVDFPRARFQEAACLASFLFARRMEGSPYFQSERLLGWTASALAYWTGLQHEDGSFDEAYPFERSLAATAFTSFYAGEALLLLGDALPADVRARVRRSLERAGDWLCANEETHGFLANHQAAAAAALLHAARASGRGAHEARSRAIVERILAHQSSEGWYEEYGGADPGYQTHGSFYLARILELAPDSTLARALASSLERSSRFLACCIHPDGSLGGEYGSRNTQTYYPAALEMRAAQDPAAAWIAETMRPSVASSAAAGARAVDAYNELPLLNSLVFAWTAASARGGGAPPAEEPEANAALVWFREAGIARVRRARYDAWIGTAKGGVTKVFDRARRRLVYSDCGYVGRLRSGALASTQVLERERAVEVGGARIAVEGTFHEVSRPVMAPLRFALFRLFTISLGRHPGLARWLKRRLVHVLIDRRRPLDIRFRRVVELDDGEVRVADELHGPGARDLADLRWEEVFTTVHMGSSRYFVPSELVASAYEGDPSHAVDPAAVASGLAVERRVRVS